MSNKVRKKHHPLLIALDIVIVILTLILAFTVAVIIFERRVVEDSSTWRYDPDQYTYDLQTGNYSSLYRAFFTGYDPVPEDQITDELRPFSAVSWYYVDSFYLQVYETMGDEARAQKTREALEQYRSDMGIYAPEADKIDKIFDSTR